MSDPSRIATSIWLFPNYTDARHAGFMERCHRHHQSPAMKAWWPDLRAQELHGVRPRMVVVARMGPLTSWQLRELHEAQELLRCALAAVENPVWVEL